MFETLKQKRQWTLKQLNWRVFLVRALVNALTLIITVIVTPTINFIDPTVVTIAFLALMLGVINAIIKPVIQFFTLSYIFATYGLVIIFINALVLYILHWLFPAMFEIINPFWALWGGAVMGIVSGFLESVFGLTLPIVDEHAISERMRQEEAKLRRRRMAFQGNLVENLSPAEGTSPVFPNKASLEPVQSSTLEVKEADMVAPSSVSDTLSTTGGDITAEIPPQANQELESKEEHDTEIPENAVEESALEEHPARVESSDIQEGAPTSTTSDKTTEQETMDAHAGDRGSEL